MPDHPDPAPRPFDCYEWEINLLRRLRQAIRDGVDLVTLSLVLKAIISMHKGKPERLEPNYRLE